MAQQEIHKILPTYRGNHRRIDDLRCRVLNCTGEDRCEPEQFARSRVSEDKAPSGLWTDDEQAHMAVENYIEVGGSVSLRIEDMIRIDVPEFFDSEQIVQGLYGQ